MKIEIDHLIQGTKDFTILKQKKCQRDNETTRSTRQNRQKTGLLELSPTFDTHSSVHPLS